MQRGYMFMCPRIVVPMYHCAHVSWCLHIIKPSIENPTWKRLMVPTYHWTGHWKSNVKTCHCAHVSMCLHIVVPNIENPICLSAIEPTYHCAHVPLCPRTVVPTYHCVRLSHPDLNPTRLPNIGILLVWKYSGKQWTYSLVNILTLIPHGCPTLGYCWYKNIVVNNEIIA